MSGRLTKEQEAHCREFGAGYAQEILAELDAVRAELALAQEQVRDKAYVLTKYAELKTECDALRAGLIDACYLLRQQGGQVNP